MSRRVGLCVRGGRRGGRVRPACVFLLLACTVLAACGKRGAPLPPLRRLPAAPTDLVAMRYAGDVFVRLTVPSTNVEGPGAATLGRMEVYAITTDRPIGESDVQTEALRNHATLIASEPVRRPLPPPPPPEPGQPAPPPLPLEPGLDQGGEMLVREALADAADQPAALPMDASSGTLEAEPSALPGPLVAPDAASGPRRYYFAVGVTPTGRYGVATPPVAVPLRAPAGVPVDPVVTYDAQAFTIRWSPPDDAVEPQSPALTDGMLPSTPLRPPPPPTHYDVYQVDPGAPALASSAAPTAINGEPLATTELRIPGVVFGTPRCFAVRSVDAVAGPAVRGPLSAPACVTPTDTFAPSAPRNLQAVAGSGAISLIWEAGTETDLGGYIVLRGEMPGDTLSPLMTTPIREPRFDDATVQAGVRYVYAVVAVDTASPANTSPQSNRAEETARQ